MSYMRMAWPLRWFDEDSDVYAYPDVGGYVNDYDNDYEHKPSLIELIGKMVDISTDDKEYAYKIMKTLAKDYGIEDKLRETPRTDAERIKLMQEKAIRITRKLGIND